MKIIKIFGEIITESLLVTAVALMALTCIFGMYYVVIMR